MGTDIEAAVIHSYSKAKISKCLGPNGISYFDRQAISTLNSLSEIKLVDKVNELVGSKGWGTQNPNKSNKPKPHILLNFLDTFGPLPFKA